MRLDEILEDLVQRANGATAAILADWEGEAVVTCVREGDSEYHIKFVGAHHGILLDRAREMTERLCLGHTREISFHHQNFHVVTVPVNSEYYVVVTFDNGTDPLAARHHIRRAVRHILADIG